MPAVDGVVSGFDTSGLIQAITDLALQPVINMRERKGDLEKKGEKISELSNNLQALADAANELATPDGLSSLSSSSTSDLIQVSHDNALVTPGAYDIVVNNQARAETEQSTAYASTGLGELSHGTLVVNYAGVDYSITIDATNDGLDALAESISTAIDGVQATTFDQGTGINPFRMMVVGETGAANTLSFDTSGLAGTPINFAETQSGLNAEISLNGVTVQSETDTFSTIPGLTIELNGVPSGTQRVSVEKDFDAMVAKVETFVEAYNEAQSFYKKNTVFNADLKLVGPLTGESSVRRVMDGLSGMISDSYSTGGAYSGLAELGISTERGGTLKLDADALRTALVNNYDEVEGFLTSDDGPLKTLQARIEDTYVDPDSGTLQSRKNSIQGTIEDLEKSIDRQEAYVDSYTARLRARFTAMEGIMASMQSTAGYLSSMLAPAPPTS